MIEIVILLLLLHFVSKYFWLTLFLRSCRSEMVDSLSVFLSLCLFFQFSEGQKDLFSFNGFFRLGCNSFKLFLWLFYHWFFCSSFFHSWFCLSIKLVECLFCFALFFFFEKSVSPFSEFNPFWILLALIKTNKNQYIGLFPSD